MSDISYADALPVSEALPEDSAPPFYVVSRNKFMVLFTATFGLYITYWAYKNWALFKAKRIEEGADVRLLPWARTVLMVFFTHSLFREVKARGADKPEVSAWDDYTNATWVVGLLVIANIIDRAAGKSIGSPYTDVLALALLAPTALSLASAQRMINIVCNDPGGERNRTYTVANYVWITLGVLLWALVAVGIFLPE